MFSEGHAACRVGTGCFACAVPDAVLLLWDNAAVAQRMEGILALQMSGEL